MPEVRIFVTRRLAVATCLVFAVFVSWSIGSFLRRLAEPPTDVRYLTLALLQGVFVSTFVGAAFAAFATSRHRRRLGADLGVSAAMDGLEQTVRQYLALVAPIVVGWFVFMINSYLQFPTPIDQLGLYVVVALMGAIASGVGVATGQLLGSVAPILVAVPSSAAIGYLLPAVLGGALDETVFQGLNPSFGATVPDRLPGVWLAGEVLWFAALTALILQVTTVLTTRPRSFRGMVFGLTVLVLLAGFGLSTYGASLDSTSTMAAGSG